MKKVLFIHGAYHAGWCWEEIKEQLLKTAKFELHTPDLPGHGQNQVPRQNVGLDTYVDYVSQYIQENNLEDFTVVAHSFGGIVASRIAEMHPEKISGIFFVSASILDNDRCFFDFMPMAVQEMYKKMAEESEDYSIEPNKESLKVKIFNESINSPKLQNFIDKLGRQPLKPYLDRVTLASFKNTNIPIYYIKCLKDISVSQVVFEEIFNNLPAHTKFLELEADHEFMLSNPVGFCQLFLQNME